MVNSADMRIHKVEAEQVATIEVKLTDPKKLILYGFALGLKADNPFGNTLGVLKDGNRELWADDTPGGNPVT